MFHAKLNCMDLDFETMRNEAEILKEKTKAAERGLKCNVRTQVRRAACSAFPS